MGDVVSFGKASTVEVMSGDHEAVTSVSPHRPSATSSLNTHCLHGGTKEDSTRWGGLDATKRARAVMRHHVHRAASAHCGSGDAEPLNAALVVARLEEAGRTLLALPRTGYSTGLRVSRLDIVQSALEAFGAECGPVRAAIPSAAQISQMDEALGWISLIPVETVARGRPSGGHILRRIVGARALVGPVTERHIYSWRRLGGVLGADHKAVQRWHAQAIDLIVAALRRPGA